MVTMAVIRLGEKIEDDPAHPRFIEAGRRFGYRSSPRWRPGFDRRTSPVRSGPWLALSCAGAVAVSTAMFGIGSFPFIRRDKPDRFEGSALLELRLQVAVAGDDVDEPATAVVRQMASEGRAVVVLVGDATSVSSPSSVTAADVPAELLGRVGRDLRTTTVDVSDTSYLVVDTDVPVRDAHAFFFFHRGRGGGRNFKRRPDSAGRLVDRQPSSDGLSDEEE